MPRELDFDTWDVFTATRFAGNPLAVVFDADDLDPTRMLRITREFDYSETVFVQAPQSEGHGARLRIFTPGGELPFAGHPVVGASCALARRRSAEGALRLELAAGSFAVEAASRAGGWEASFINPNLPRLTGTGPSAAQAAAALGLSTDDIAVGSAAPARADAGIEFVYARSSLEAVAQARLDPAGWDALLLGDACGLLLYAWESQGREHRVHARMFAPHIGVPEDPATGSAAAALPAHLGVAAPLEDGRHRLIVVQGVEMGRASRIEVDFQCLDRRFVELRVGGSAVPVMQGRLLC